MSRLKIAVATAFLLALSGCAGDRAQSTQSETAGQYVDDATITTEVKAGLIHDQELKAFDIHVKTDKGVVILSGLVPTRVQKSDATRVARSVGGVKDVVNDLATQQ